MRGIRGVSCDRVVQSSLFFDSAAAQSVRFTLEGAQHLSFIRQPYINQTAAPAIAWLLDQVKGDASRVSDAYMEALLANGTLVDMKSP